MMNPNLMGNTYHNRFPSQYPQAQPRHVVSNQYPPPTGQFALPAPAQIPYQAFPAPPIHDPCSMHAICLNDNNTIDSDKIAQITAAVASVIHGNTK